MISVLPAWYPIFFVSIVAAVYVLLVSAFNFANQQLEIVAQERSLVPMMVRLVLLCWLFATASLTIYGWARSLSTILVGSGVLLAVLLSFRSMYKLAQQIPVQWIILTQSFRLFVEVFLFLLCRKGLMAQELTWQGKNFDIVFAVTAPIVATLSMYFGARLRWTLLFWNLGGIFSLIYFVRIVLLSTAMSSFLLWLHFPYIWLFAFLIPVAIFLHFISIYKMWCAV